MEMNNFDTELFIEEVKSRRVIWDMASPDYKNRVLKRTAWQQLVEIFCKKLGCIKVKITPADGPKTVRKCSGVGAEMHEGRVGRVLHFSGQCVSSTVALRNWCGKVVRVALALVARSLLYTFERVRELELLLLFLCVGLCDQCRNLVYYLNLRCVLGLSIDAGGYVTSEARLRNGRAAFSRKKWPPCSSQPTDALVHITFCA
ncbi:hypothetical protein LSTR_LSTR002251 [Laodelphax striatellus]|uniref:MADF domain-containing protein n=1 Tax=Laodelphax striatellus TaxID=195883 RepID=A0A482XGP0_LAOST|nr:hypothetical protein LSTR_LSTR002251 [Laodelphax striatellus]